MKRLKKGDYIRIVSPSSSIESIGGFEANVAAKKKLEALGFRLSFTIGGQVEIDTKTFSITFS